MGRSIWERQALDSIKDQLADSEPRLAAMLAAFTSLASGEEMPTRSQVRAASLRATRRSLTRRRSPGQHRLRKLSQWAYRHLSLLCILMWLATTIALVVGGIAFSQDGARTACTGSWPAPCAPPAPSSPRNSAGVTGNDVPARAEMPSAGVKR